MRYIFLLVCLFGITLNITAGSLDNTKISLGKTEFTSKILDFAWCGKFPEIIYRNSPI